MNIKKIFSNDNFNLMFIVWLSTMISYLVMFFIGSFYFLNFQLKLIIIFGISFMFLILFFILNFITPHRKGKKIVYTIVTLIAIGNMANLISDGVRTMPAKEFILVSSNNLEKLKENNLESKINLLSPYKKETLLMRSIIIENNKITNFLLTYQPKFSIQDSHNKTAYDYCLSSSENFKKQFNCKLIKP